MARLKHNDTIIEYEEEVFTTELGFEFKIHDIEEVFELMVNHGIPTEAFINDVYSMGLDSVLELEAETFVEYLNEVHARTTKIRQMYEDF